MDRSSWRRQATPLAGLIVSLVFAALLAPLPRLEHWLGATQLRAGQTAPVTIRLSGADLDDPALGPGRILVARGDRVSPEVARVVEQQSRRAAGPIGGTAGLFVAFLVAGLLLLATLRPSVRGRSLRAQVAVLGSFVAIAAAVKALLLLTQTSAFVIP